MAQNNRGKTEKRLHSIFTDYAAVQPFNYQSRWSQVQLSKSPLTLISVSVSWAINQADIQRVDAVDQWCLRRISDIRWHDFVRNVNVQSTDTHSLTFLTFDAICSMLKSGWKCVLLVVIIVIIITTTVCLQGLGLGPVAHWSLLNDSRIKVCRTTWGV